MRTARVSGIRNATRRDFSSSTNRITKVGFGYDTAGNPFAPGRPDDKFDGENKLISSVGNVLTTYVYDPDGRRVKKTEGSVTTKFVYNSEGQVIAEYGGAPPAFGLQFATADHLGSPRAWTSHVGVAPNGRHDYAPFGEELTQAFGLARPTIGGYPAGVQTDGQRRQFGNYERDSESGLDFVQARHYSNIQGRFISPDAPLVDQSENEPQSWNLYSYVRNSPCINNDPTGRNSCYYREDNSKIACHGNTRLQITTKGGQGTLIYTHEDGRREVRDLNTVKAVTFASTAPNPIADLAVQMQLRSPAIKQAIGIVALPYVLGAGAAGIGATVGVGGIGFGSTITTLGIGGGTTTAVGATGTVAVTFTSHGTVHALMEGLSRTVVEAAIRTQVQALAAGASATGQFWGRVVVEGVPIIYRAYALADGTVKIGTYYSRKK